MKRYRNEVIRRGGGNSNQIKTSRLKTHQKKDPNRFTPAAKRRLKKAVRKVPGKTIGIVLSDNLHEKNSTTNTAVNTAIATKNAIKSFRNSVKNIKRTKKIIRYMVKLVAIIIKSPLIVKLSLVLAALLLITVLVGGIIMVFMAFFSPQADQNTVLAYKNEVERLDAQFLKEIDKLKFTPGYKECVVTYMNEDGTFKTDWKAILSYMSVKYEQQLTFSEDEQKSIAELYNKMHYLKTRSETIGGSSTSSSPAAVSSPLPVANSSPPVSSSPENNNPKENSKDPAEKKLIIEVYSKSIDDIMASSGFTADQIEWYTLLMESNLADFYPNLGLADPNALSDAEMKKLIANAQRTSTSRQELIDVALTLVGHLKYFWGGKSSAGWNSDWGKLKQVTADGSNATRTMQPYGLDCSGFVDWCYQTAGIGTLLAGGTTLQWQNSYPITDAELLPGDLVFKDSPGSSGINHVGLFYRRDTNGVKQYIHCTSPDGVVINSYSGFKYWRRPYVKFTDE